ncbi:MAG: hypothetical protein JJE18_04500 [Eubacteriaceae bacterium]|nr:hypothetical protein [Eubacteriaceae bacterium]
MDARLDWFIASVGFICVIGTFLICYFSFGRTKKKDDREEGASIATITSDTGYIKSSLEGINTKLEKSDERHGMMIERMVKVESSTNSAHKRIDEVIKKGEK